MKHYVSVMMGAAVFCASLGTAQAEETQKSGWFVAPSIGTTTSFQSETKGNFDGRKHASESAMTLGIAVGKQITPHFSGELSVSHLDSPISQSSPNMPNVGNIKVVGAMLNGYYKMSPEQSFSPYLMLGVGVEHQELTRTEDFAQTTTNSVTQGQKPEKYSGLALAYQVGLGVSYTVNSSWSVFAGSSIKDSTPAKLFEEKKGVTAVKTGLSVEPIKAGFSFIF